MAAYRLYTEDVAQGITDFNDEYFHVLETYTDSLRHTIALIYNERGKSFLIAHGLHHEDFNSIHWDYGNYYDKITHASHDFLCEIEDIKRTFNDNEEE